MTTTTTRRTTKLSANARGHVAIKCEYISEGTDEILCKANKAMRIEGVNGASVDLKAGEEFWLSRAASLGPDMFYVVRLVLGAKKCSCPAAKPCKHEKRVAVRETERREKARLAALKKREEGAAQIVIIDEQFGIVIAVEDWHDMETPAPEVSPQPESDLGERGSLNGQRGFSLLR